jgi:hypothetical protein
MGGDVMKTTAPAIALLTFSLLCGADEILIGDKMTVLGCTGESPKGIASTEMVKARASVRVSKGMFYIKIDGLAYGTSSEAPRPHESTSVAGNIQLTPSSSSDRSVLAKYTLNYSSGDLFVGPPEGGKVFFIGVCKNAVPIF